MGYSLAKKNKNALKVLERFGMSKSNLVLNPIVSSCELLKMKIESKWTTFYTNKL